MSRRNKAVHLHEVCEVDVDDLLNILSSIFPPCLVHYAAVYMYTS